MADPTKLTNEELASVLDRMNADIRSACIELDRLQDERAPYWLELARRVMAIAKAPGKPLGQFIAGGGCEACRASGHACDFDAERGSCSIILS